MRMLCWATLGRISDSYEYTAYILGVGGYTYLFGIGCTNIYYLFILDNV